MSSTERADCDPDLVHPADRLRTSANVFASDPRIKRTPSESSTTPVPSDLQLRLAQVSQFELSSNVPVRIRIHFETAKNLFVYSWFVYRFHMVAQQHALATLELALRTRFFPPDGETEDKKATLRPMLERAINERLLTPSEFTVVRRVAVQRALDREWQEAILKHRDDDVGPIEIDESNVVPLPEDYSSEWLENWVKAAPKMRNIHAHGTASLSPSVLGTFQNVMDAINQLWKTPSTVRDTQILLTPD